MFFVTAIVILLVVWMILDREVYLPLIKPDQQKLGFGQWSVITLVTTTVLMSLAHVVNLAGRSLPELLRLFGSAMLTRSMQGDTTGGLVLRRIL